MFQSVLPFTLKKEQVTIRNEKKHITTQLMKHISIGLRYINDS